MKLPGYNRGFGGGYRAALDTVWAPTLVDPRREIRHFCVGTDYCLFCAEMREAERRVRPRPITPSPSKVQT